jgi:thiamine-monophosphate kinase
MLVSELGEFGLIELLARELGLSYPAASESLKRAGLLVDLGDDALVTRHAEGSLILTTDTMVEGVHFLPGRVAWEDVGWKSLASNLSDIAAMGGEPHVALVTLILSAEAEADDVLALYRGMRECAETHGVLIAGGDVVRGPAFAVTVSLSGWAFVGAGGEAKALVRGAARLGDVVAVTGTLGDSAAGLRLIQDQAPADSDAARRLIRAHTRPVPRLEAGRAAVAAGIECGMDVSDGLVQDLGHIARASGVGIRLDAARVPLSQDLTAVFPAEAIGLALTGGEDYELILVGPMARMESLLGRPDLKLSLIGEVVHYDQPRVAVVDESGAEMPVGRAGWDHLRPDR